LLHISAIENMTLASAKSSEQKGSDSSDSEITRDSGSDISKNRWRKSVSLVSSPKIN